MKPSQVANYRSATDKMNMIGVTTGAGKKHCTKCKRYVSTLGGQARPFVCKECKCT